MRKILKIVSLTQVYDINHGTWQQDNQQPECQAVTLLTHTSPESWQPAVTLVSATMMYPCLLEMMFIRQFTAEVCSKLMRSIAF